MKATMELLKTSGLRRTAAREGILQLLSRARQPLSSQHILKRCRETGAFDRVTVYRTLETLQSAGLIHRIQGADGIRRFCLHARELGKCGGNHIHFQCSKCDRMFCLPGQPLPWVLPPAGAVIHSKQLVVYGHCAACGARAPLDSECPSLKSEPSVDISARHSRNAQKH